MAGKKRAMSLEDKRDTLLNIFHESKDVFVLKDVEKLGSKRGVVLQTIKEVLQGLVDDNLVKQERIGASNYFWSFPSDMTVALTSDRDRKKARLEGLKQEHERLDGALAASRLGKEDSDERRSLAAKVAELQALLAEQGGELAQFAENDPERYESMQKSVRIALDSANRWIDNIFCLQSWLNKMMEGQRQAVKDIFKHAGDLDIDNLDNVEL